MIGIGSPELRKIGVNVDRRGVHGRMPHEDLNVANVGSAFDEGGGEGMPELMGPYASPERGLRDCSHAVVDLLAR